MVCSCRALKYMVSVLFFPLLPFIFMLVTIGYWAASAIFLASMGKADFSLVNKTTYTDADGEVQTVVEQLEDTVPCDVNVSMRHSASIAERYTNALNYYMYRISCVGERHVRTSVQLPQLRWRRVSSKILLHSFSNIITQKQIASPLAGLPSTCRCSRSSCSSGSSTGSSLSPP